MRTLKTAIIGAGAAGCFCAIELKRRLPQADVTIYEAGPKALAKVAITGGGRCNLTNSFENISSLQEAYPRGARLMQRAFCRFSPEDCRRWFEKEGVRLVIQDDGCVFPESQNAMEIVGTLLRLNRELGVKFHLGKKISDLSEIDSDIKIVTTGGSPKISGLSFLDAYELEIVPPVPSLFTFEIKDFSLRELAGTVVDNVEVRICGTQYKAEGPLLITDWGVSGPAVLKLSSYSARFLADNAYKADLSINWGCSFRAESSQRLVNTAHPAELTSRLWSYLVNKCGLRQGLRCAEIGSKGMNKLNEILRNDVYHIEGKGRFKEEFVTCGGVALNNIDINTLEAKKYPGLYFAGEVLDVDAITGGFNLQAAWSMAYVIASSVAERVGQDSSI